MPLLWPQVDSHIDRVRSDGSIQPLRRLTQLFIAFPLLCLAIRRLSSNNDLVGLFPKLSGENIDHGLVTSQPPPDVTAAASSANNRPKMTLTLAVPDLRPASPAPGGLKRTKSSGKSRSRSVQFRFQEAEHAPDETIKSAD